MKNILNIGVFIVLLQSANWLTKTENLKKISEYFILLFSTLIGNSTQKQKSLLITSSSLNLEVLAIAYVYKISDNLILKKILPIFEKM